MRRLTLIQVLVFYDVPQIFVAVDATGTHYLCTLFSDAGDEGHCYLGVQISESRLTEFTLGKLELRMAYTHPEVDNALYQVVARQEMLQATALQQPDAVSEAMLPEAGYFFSPDDLAEATTATDTYQLEVPVSDRHTFATIINRMGWKASSIQKVMGKIAAL